MTFVAPIQYSYCHRKNASVHASSIIMLYVALMSNGWRLLLVLRFKMEDKFRGNVDIATKLKTFPGQNVSLHIQPPSVTQQRCLSLCAVNNVHIVATRFLKKTNDFTFKDYILKH